MRIRANPAAREKFALELLAGLARFWFRLTTFTPSAGIAAALLRAADRSGVSLRFVCPSEETSRVTEASALQN